MFGQEYRYFLRSLVESIVSFGNESTKFVCRLIISDIVVVTVYLVKSARVCLSGDKKNRDSEDVLPFVVVET